MSFRQILLSVAALVSFLGVINAGYLAFTALAGVAPTCNFLHGCEVVAASPYSKVFGIPLALFGVFFYVVTFGLSVWGFFVREKIFIHLFALFAVPGFLLSLYFLYLQAYRIGAFCEYCLFSLFDASVLFVIALILYIRFRNERTHSASGIDSGIINT